MMTPLVLVALAAMLASYGAVRLMLRADSRKLMDVPNERSSHVRPTPRGGGLGIVFVTLIGVWVAWMVVGVWPPRVFASFFAGALITAAVGLYDDANSLSARIRLAIQVAVAALTVALSGFAPAIHLASFPSLDLTWVGPAVAFIWVIGLTNAYNFMDGIDGMAGLQGVVAGFGWAALGWFAHMPMVSIVGVLLGAASLGFLGLNWHPARIFLGDVGSTFLGYCFAALTLIAGAHNLLLGVCGTLLLFPFLFDSLFTFLRRLLSGENILRPHRTHLYQRLVVAGLSHSVVALFYGLLSSLGVVIALVLVTGGSESPMLLVVPAACLCLCLTVAGTTGSLHTFLDGSRFSQKSFKGWLDWMETIQHVNRVGTWTIQALIFALSGSLAFLLRFDFAVPPFYLPVIAKTLLVWVLVKSVVFRLHGLDRGWWQYVSVHDLVLIGGCNLAGSLCSMVFIVGLALPAFPRSLYLIDFLIALLATTGVRLCARIASDLLVGARQTEPLKRVLIYGAGRAGTTLLREIHSNSRLHFQVLGFIDDHERKQGLVVQGARVLGTGADLSGLVQKQNVEEILVALPSVTGPHMTQVLQTCQELGVRCRTIPPLDDIIRNRNLSSQIRDVTVEDLLGRSPVRLEEHGIRRKLTGKVVMVTGAAGSIGSELCRQIARFRPQAIIGFEVAETALFHLAREMKAKYPDVCFVPAIGSVQNRARLREVFLAHGPSIIYHAAAYKHVPMMEAHVVEAVENNVFGTYQVALAAAEHGATDLVMISSDKAVRPTNIMGATKRVAELLISAMQNDSTNFVSVRFGNVLGSNGSVVPLFKEQIAAGGPVTVTDPNMERYFMTIPEASQLVLQASSMGNGGEIFVLDMGAPVRIMDLARNLIRLSGFQPDHDIRIEVTGIRPGEKIREELSTLEENTLPTRHPKIKIFKSPQTAHPIMRHLDALQDLCDSRNVVGIVERLKRIVPEYRPSSFVQPDYGSAASRSATA